MDFAHYLIDPAKLIYKLGQNGRHAVSLTMHTTGMIKWTNNQNLLEHTKQLCMTAVSIHEAVIMPVLMCNMCSCF